MGPCPRLKSLGGSDPGEKRIFVATGACYRDTFTYFLLPDRSGKGLQEREQQTPEQNFHCCYVPMRSLNSSIDLNLEDAKWSDLRAEKSAERGAARSVLFAKHN
jgi:hypothetical protein